MIRFSGIAKDETGKPMLSVLGVTFALYKDEQGGASLWVETQNVQADANGNYTVMLGATKPDGLPVDLFTSGEARWVGVRTGEQEQPRVLLVSVPYAIKAHEAETLAGRSISDFVLNESHAGTSSIAPSGNVSASGHSATSPRRLHK
jgi:trimeric autotransporter adhesin